MAVTSPLDIPIRFVLPPAALAWLALLDDVDEVRAEPDVQLADLDALADTLDDDAPEVLGVRVIVPGTLVQPRTYPTGRTWDVERDGRLLVVDEHERGIAEFAPGCWSSVEDVLAEVDA